MSTGIDEKHTFSFDIDIGFFSGLIMHHCSMIFISTDRLETRAHVIGKFFPFFLEMVRDHTFCHRDFSDVFLSEDEAAEFCAGINENDLDEIHIDEIIQDAVNIISFV